MPALPPTLVRSFRRWYVALPAALAAGCVVALILRLIATGRTWEATGQGIGLLLGVAGLVLGIMMAYGGRGTMGDTRRDPRGERRRGVVHPARPVLGFAEALFCLPTVIATLTM